MVATFKFSKFTFLLLSAFVSVFSVVVVEAENANHESSFFVLPDTKGSAPDGGVVELEKGSFLLLATVLEKGSLVVVTEEEKGSSFGVFVAANGSSD